MPRDERIRALCARVLATAGFDFYPAIAELEDAIDSYLVSLPEFSTYAACPQCGRLVTMAQRLGVRFILCYRCPQCEAASVIEGDSRQ